MSWINTEDALPNNGTIVFIKTKKNPCSCSGYQEREVYYDNGIFYGIKNQRWVNRWRVSPANYLVKELECVA